MLYNENLSRSTVHRRKIMYNTRLTKWISVLMSLFWNLESAQRVQTSIKASLVDHAIYWQMQLVDLESLRFVLMSGYTVSSPGTDQTNPFHLSDKSGHWEGDSLNIIFTSLSQRSHFLKMLSKSLHWFLSFVVHGQTNKQTNLVAFEGFLLNQGLYFQDKWRSCGLISLLLRK